MRRLRALNQVRALFRTHSVVTVIGPRQCGKTTLAKDVMAGVPFRRGPVTHFDLEDPRALAQLTETPLLTLEPLEGLVVIDEVQRVPELFPLLRVLVDQNPRRRFLVLGSASGDLMRQTSESLAGRAAQYELTPFTHYEVVGLERLWLRGGFPRAWLARSDTDAFTWLDAYVTTFLERDLPSLGVRVPAVALRRFWMMLAHLHGQIVNLAELGRAFGADAKTVGRYVDLLTDTFMLRQLQPWHANVAKRQVKAPKVYLRDSGLLHALHGLGDRASLFSHPVVGASWEGFALESVIRELGLTPTQCFFWATHSGAELDLFVRVRGKNYGFEFKRSDAPRLSPSMRIALEDLKLERLFVICPGDARASLHERVTTLGLNRMSREFAKL